MTVKRVTAKIATPKNPDEIKKALQKTIKKIRDERGLHEFMGRQVHYEYPKAMATKKQMANGTATVNCGHGDAEEMANMVLNDERFKEFLNKYGVKATIETPTDKYRTHQVRLYF